MSLPIVGIQLDGIWHTSVVVHGFEWYYGNGINAELPGQTIMGTPHQKIDMGVTEIPEDIFFEYIEELRQIYTFDKYHLLDNNCNTFSNAVCEFLVGKSIPSHITNLPDDILQTPMGQMIRPYIDAMFNPRPPQ
ncbi:10300_t:CDS:2 [Paraglomus brasilianum]|uniref:10300_t:CDS:1 n=1 Tax=Paraglomus brasilianum TaxID=144538 RepID=A0A9N9C3R3_9GLOM|nr:10300_t:CDS:2 [Paraglomus brasilianum]